MEITMYQDTTTIPGLIEPTAVVPAEIARYVPPPQPAYVPANSPGMPGVVVNPDGSTHYGFAPMIYAGQQPLADPQAMARAMDRIADGVNLAGKGAAAAGVGFGISQVLGALAGASAGTLLLFGAVVVASKVRAPRQIINNIKEENHYDQSIINVARGWFSHADGSIGNDTSKTFINNA